MSAAKPLTQMLGEEIIVKKFTPMSRNHQMGLEDWKLLRRKFVGNKKLQINIRGGFFFS